MRSDPVGSLVSATQFDDVSCWRGRLVPAAGELNARFGSFVLPRRSGVSEPTDLEKCARDRLQRARRRVRHFVVSNGLSHHVTLTFASQPASGLIAGSLVGRFFRRVTHRFSRVPFVWPLEYGSRRGRVHAHALLGALDEGVLDSLWRLGRTDHEFVGGGAEALRAAAGYFVKDLDRGPLQGGQAYRVAKGFQPVGISLSGLDHSLSVISEACHLMDADPTQVVDSARGAFLTAYWDV